MLLKELEQAKTDNDFVWVDSKVCCLPNGVIKKFLTRAEKLGMVIDHGEEIEWVNWPE